MKYFPPKKIVSALQPIDMVYTDVNEKLSGRVLMVHISDNNEVTEMIAKLANHRNGYLITKVNTDTNLFQKSIFTRAHAVCFLQGRVKFLNEFHVEMKKASPFPVCILSFGQNASKDLFDKVSTGKINGTYISIIRKYITRQNASDKQQEIELFT